MEINRPETLEEVRAAFARCEDAPVNDRVEVLDELFWPAPRTVRYGVDDNLVGIEAIRAFRAARSPVGLARTLADTVITTFGRDCTTAMTEFRREGSPMVGRQSQNWIRFPQGGGSPPPHVGLISAPRN